MQRNRRPLTRGKTKPAIRVDAPVKRRRPPEKRPEGLKDLLGKLLEFGVFNGRGLLPHRLGSDVELLDQVSYQLRMIGGKAIQQTEFVVGRPDAAALGVLTCRSIRIIRKQYGLLSPVACCLQQADATKLWLELLGKGPVLMICGQVDRVEDIKEDTYAIRGSGATLLGVGTVYNPHNFTADDLGLEIEEHFWPLFNGSDLEPLHQPPTND